MKSESAQKSQKITDTPEFKRWFGDSKAVGRRIGQALLRAIAQNQACDPGDDEPSEALRRLMRMTG